MAAGSESKDDPLALAALWQQEGKRVALGVVMKTWGSSPRPVGSLLAVREDGTFMGSVSGGCIEGAVIREALEMIENGPPRRLSFGVSDEEAWGVGLACGGSVEVLLFCPLPLQPLALELASGHSMALVIDLASGGQTLLGNDTRSPLATGLAEEGARFVLALRPALKLVIIGAVHIAQALAPMAALAGFQVTVIDPRGAFASPERFPGTEVCSEWPDDALANRPLDASTALVALSHDPKLDDPALQLALASPAFYIGALGSKTNQARRLQRLGAGEGRIHGPIGLDIGAKLPEEIAISILAEIIQALRRPQTAS
jgi:xanthine dehydrogenase accessory factor